MHQDLHHIHKRKKKQKARNRRALLVDDSGSFGGFGANVNRYSKKEKKKKVNEEWVIKPRKRSVDVDGDDEDLMQQCEDDDEDEEADGDKGNADDVEADVETEALPSSSGCISTPAVPIPMDEDDGSDDEEARKRRYVGLATGWSEEDEEEDSFDADLFFTNLYASSTSCSEDESEDIEERLQGPFDMGMEMDEDGDEGGDEDDSSFSSVETETETETFLPLPPSNPTPAFELTESWDGRVVFTNGTGFECDLELDLGSMTSATSAAEDSPYTSRGRSRSSSVSSFSQSSSHSHSRPRSRSNSLVGTTKVRKGLGRRGRRRRKVLARVGGMMSDDAGAGDVESENGEGEGEDLTTSLTFEPNVRDQHYYQVVGGVQHDFEPEHSNDHESNSGDTTDEELVGPDSLPNERALQMFKFPETVVSTLADSIHIHPNHAGPTGDSIDPMSIVSSPIMSGAIVPSLLGAWQPLRPADILEGRRNETSAWPDDDFCMHTSESEGEGDRRRSHHRFRTPSISSRGTPSHGMGGKDPRNYITPPPRSASSMSMVSGPRKGVFVAPKQPSVQSGRNVVVVIGDERKGRDVPSPHPRILGRGRKKPASGITSERETAVCLFFFVLPFLHSFWLSGRESIEKTPISDITQLIRTFTSLIKFNHQHREQQCYLGAKFGSG